MLIPRMQPGLDLWHLFQKIPLIIIVHVIIPITLEMLDGLMTNGQPVLLGTLTRLATNLGMGVTYLSLFFVFADVFALREVADPLGLVLAYPYVVVLGDMLLDF